MSTLTQIQEYRERITALQQQVAETQGMKQSAEHRIAEIDVSINEMGYKPDELPDVIIALQNQRDELAKEIESRLAVLKRSIEKSNLV